MRAGDPQALAGRQRLFKQGLSFLTTRHPMGLKVILRLGDGCERVPRMSRLRACLLLAGPPQRARLGLLQTSGLSGAIAGLDVKPELRPEGRCGMIMIGEDIAQGPKERLRPVDKRGKVFVFAL